VSALSIRGVGRTFPGVNGGQPTLALQPTDLHVAHNDFITVLGPSGCGKSTLLRIVAGLDTPTLGQVLLDGQQGVPKLHAVPLAHGAPEHLLRLARKAHADERTGRDRRTLHCRGRLGRL
jgi:ABC-type oligopeptide transport system ATPase subunit